MNNQIEQTIDSREVAEMVEKDHGKLLKDIRRYIKQLGEAKIGFTDFFIESTYRSEQNKELPCYHITKKGCEFIAHKLTGTKGTRFTAQYINKFHAMENTLAEGMGMQQLQQLQEAVEMQGKILKGISSQLSLGTALVGIGGRTMNDRYRSEIIRMVGMMQSEKALCKVYTFAKYVPQ